MIEKPALSIKNLSFSYGTHTVLEDISFDVPKGKILCILGANGAGKSTLFKCILGLLNSFDGEINVYDEFKEKKPLHAMSYHEKAQNIAYVPQSHDGQFEYQVTEMIMMGTYAKRSIFSGPKKNQKTKALEILKKLNIEYLSQRNYARISGGERQLVLIARAMCQDTPIIVMDEPIGNLDYGNQLRILEKIRELANSGYTIIMSSHNPDQAMMFSDTIVALDKGHIDALGIPREVITSELLKKLYNVEAHIYPIAKGAIRICVPDSALKQ